MPKKIRKISKASLPIKKRDTAIPSSRPPLTRMMKLHELLAAGKLPNCAKLAEALEVSSKTIQRDIDFMRDQMDLPIAYDQQKHGFYYSQSVGQFPMVTVSEGEIVALLVAQKAIEQYRGTSFEKPLRSAFDKLAGSLEGEASVSLHELSEAVSFRAAGVPRGSLKVFEVLAESVVTSRVVEFLYHSLKAKAPEPRKVEPYHLACIANQWYLIANDLGRGQLRTFALSRVAKPKALAQKFQKPADFSATQMLSDSFSAFEAAKPEKVRITFSNFAARLISERQWHKTQKLRPLPSGGVELEMRVGVAPDLESWILGWGSHAIVEEPASLRKTIAEAAHSLSAAYRK